MTSIRVDAVGALLLFASACVAGVASKGSGVPSTPAAALQEVTATPTVSSVLAPDAPLRMPALPSESIPQPPGVEMIPPGASAFVLDLQTLGLDPKNLPSLEELDPKALRGVMKLIAKSLGVKCAACHLEGDFAAPTRAKNIAARMWNEFATNLALPDASPFFCDSCHHSRTALLERHDAKALAEWMNSNFVAKLARKDGQPNGCETCHVGMEMHLLAKWATP